MVYVPRGSAFRVNTQTIANQEGSDIAVLSNGGFVVVWEDQNEPLANANIKAQIYDVSGAKVGGELLVNTQTSANQVFAAVTSLSGSRFVVTWTDGSGIGDGNFASVQAQIFDATGNKIGSEFLVNTQATSAQAFSEIAPLTSGGFVITWIDAVGFNVKAQIYDANGSRVGGELTVGAQGYDFRVPAAVAGLANGGFVVAFESGNGVLGSGSTNSIKAQFFDAAGAKVGGEFLANTTTPALDGTPDIAVLNDGRLIICWHQDIGEIEAQLFDASGQKLGAEFQVNTKTQFDQYGPSIAALANGRFIISWTDQNTGFADGDIKAQIFDAAGAKVGSEFLVSPASTFNQVQPAVAGFPDGDFLVTWTDHSFTLGDTSGSSVQAQAYQFLHTQTVHWTASVDVGAHPAGWLPAGIGDFNNDGSSDLAWYNAASGDLEVWKLSNGHWAGSSDIGPHPAGYQPAGFGDFNHDGTSDVIWYNATTRDVDLWKVSNGQWAGSVDVGTHPAGYLPALTGDFNGDGTSDVLWYNATSRDAEIWMIQNGQWAGSIDIGTHPAGYQPAAAGDFNGDGTSDIAWFNAATGDVDVWQISNGHWAGSVDIGAHPAGWQPLGAGDFNKDGSSDIAWYNPATNDVEVWLISNGHWAASVDLGSHPAGSVAVGVGDVDHNGVSDIMWRDTSTGHIENWLLAYS